MSKAESPTKRHHLRRLADMSGTTRDAPDAAASVLTRARRRAIESSTEDDNPDDDARVPATPTSSYLRSLSSRRTPAAPSAESTDSLRASPTRRTTTVDRASSPTKGSNPFSSAATLRRAEAARSTSPTRPSQSLAARLAAVRSGDARSSAFVSAPAAAGEQERGSEPESDRMPPSRMSRSPTKSSTAPSETKLEGISRRRSLRSRPAVDENENPFAPGSVTRAESPSKQCNDQATERTQRLIRRRSLRTTDGSDKSRTESDSQGPTSVLPSTRVTSAFSRRTPDVDRTSAPSTFAEKASTPPASEARANIAKEAAEKERKEQERQERLARRRSLYSYLPPKRVETDVDAQEDDNILASSEAKPKTPPKMSAYALQGGSALSRTSNPFVRSRPKSSAGLSSTDPETNINEVKGSFQRLSLEANHPKPNEYTPVRGSRPPVTTPGLHQGKERPHSSSLVSAVATVSRVSRLPLRGCTILVDVRDQDGEDVSSPWIDKLKGAGAKVYSRWPGEKTVLTHVVWKSGRPSTLNMMRALEKEVERQLEENGQAAPALTAGERTSTTLVRRRSMKSFGDGESRSKAIIQEDQKEILSMPLIVGVGWAQACVSEGRLVEEEPFLVEIGKEAIFNRRRRSSMAPKSLPASPSSSEATPRATPTHSRGRKSLASSGLRSEIEKARRQSLQYAPVVSSPLRKRCFIDPDAFTTTPLSKYSSSGTTTPPAKVAISIFGAVAGAETPLTTPAPPSYIEDGYPLPTGLKWGVEAIDISSGPDQYGDGVVAMDLD
ncbi:hypothetical protein OC844_004798 [Tilletia horrida]|nr:hypothetical protein OC844_004798 [Tilletia horrida]